MPAGHQGPCKARNEERQPLHLMCLPELIGFFQWPAEDRLPFNIQLPPEENQMSSIEQNMETTKPAAPAVV